MATKVKGEKIKEGSIPLSAIEPLNYSLSDPEDYLKFKDAVQNEKAGFSILQDYYKFQDVFITSVRYAGGDAYVIRGIRGNKTYYNGDVNISTNPTVIFTEQHEIKSDVPTPDWNAQPGDAGYIENKTHFIEWDNKPEDENFNDLLLGLKDKTPISVTEDGYIKIVKYVATNLSPMYEYDFEYFYKNWESDSNDIFRAFITVPDIFGGNAHPEISFSDDDDLYVTIQWNTEDTTDNVNEVIDQICGDYYIVPYHNYSVYPLNENYLPNTLLKTTPQTLSDTDKNQALANLGIDPVVWKYMCNPIKLDGRTEIPEELIGEKFYRNGEELYKFKYLIPSMYIIVDDINTVVTSIESDFDYDNTKSIGFYTGDSTTVIYINPDTYTDIKYRDS